jgi:hypothetical protein
MKKEEGGFGGEDEGAPSVGTILNAGGSNKGKEEVKFQAFKGQGVSLAAPPQDDDADMKDEAAALYQAYKDDPELAFAIKMSMMEEEAKKLVVPEEPDANAPDSVNIQLRMPDGSKLQRRFSTGNKVGDIMNFIKKTRSDAKAVKLSTTFPKKVFEDASKTLKECGLTKNEALIVEIK